MSAVTLKLKVAVCELVTPPHNPTDWTYRPQPQRFQATYRHGLCLELFCAIIFKNLGNEPAPLNKNNFKVLSAILLSLAFFVLLFFGLGGAFLPLIISFGMAYLFFPVILIAEAKGIKRVWAVLGVFSTLSLAGLILLVILVPMLIKDAQNFIAELPQNSTLAIEKFEQLFVHFGFKIDLSREGIKDFLLEHTSSLSTDVLKTSSVFLAKIFSGFVKGVVWILNLLLIPIFFFHLISRYEKIWIYLIDLVPPKYRLRVTRYSTVMDTVLKGYVRGQIIVSLILALLYSIGFSILGLKFGFLIGLMTGVLSIIPFVGALIGCAAALVVSLANFSGLGQIFGIGVVFGIVQTLEGFWITPKLVGDKLGLSDLATILSLIIGGNLLGFAGLIVAIPLAAFLKIVFQDLKKYYQASNLFSAN